MYNNTNTKQNLRILVTGATGFIGSRIVKRLLADGHYKIRCMTRNPETIYELFNLSGDIVEIINHSYITKSGEIVKHGSIDRTTQWDKLETIHRPRQFFECYIDHL